MEGLANGRTGIERWLHRVGYAAEWVRQTVDTVKEFAAEAAETVPERIEEPESAVEREDEEPVAESDVFALASTTAAGLLTAQFLRPREVNWPRAVLAGVIGTLLYDAESLLDARLAGRKIDTRSPLRVSFTEDPDLETVMEWGAHYAAGIGLASFYARYLYGRLPGPPLAQGLAFGALEAATLSFGGAMRLMNALSPEIRLPPAYAGLRKDNVEPWQHLLRHLAFGVAVGLIYREGRTGRRGNTAFNIDLGKALQD